MSQPPLPSEDATTGNNEPNTTSAMEQDPTISPPETDQDAEKTLDLTVTYHQQPITLTLPSTATISDLSALIEADFSIPPSNQKILIAPKPGLLRPPFRDPALPLASLNARKITLLGSTHADIASLNATLATVRSRASARAAAQAAGRRVTATRYVNPRAADDAKFTFAQIRPLAHLRDPAGSMAFLRRLADDRGIKAAMRKWKFTVGLLTEMDPAAHTTHESRTLGLNRNGGEVIELRLWTDGYEGWRDYRTVRRTLCHELAHNVHSEHDGKFWALYREIEAVVAREDGGRSMGAEYGDEVEEEHVDGGGWSGGSYVLGGVGGVGGLSRREVLAQAAEDRMTRSRQQERETERPDGDEGL